MVTLGDPIAAGGGEGRAQGLLPGDAGGNRELGEGVNNAVEQREGTGLRRKVSTFGI